MSAQMYYRYILYNRPAGRDPNIIHLSGRLFNNSLLTPTPCGIGKIRIASKRATETAVRPVHTMEFKILWLRILWSLDPTQIGKIAISNSSFTTSGRAMQQLYQDSMELVRHSGKPDLFFAFTATPKWKEITSELRLGQSYMDRPDVAARVFRAKLKLMIYLLKKAGLLGDWGALVYTIEYQKRILPHAHILLCLENHHAFIELEQIDNIICTELPN